jgi:hypothetical protein
MATDLNLSPLEIIELTACASKSSCHSSRPCGSSEPSPITSGWPP